MIRTFVTAAALLAAALPADAAAQTSDPAALFASERAAAGPGWSTAAEIVERGTYYGSGLSGTYVTYIDPRSGHSKTIVTLAGTTQAQGYDAKGAWSAQAGLVEPNEDAASVASARTAEYVARNGWWNPQTDAATFLSLGRKSEAGKAFDVVRVTPQGGDAVDVWLDASTHLIAKLVETDLSNVTTTTTFTDYRSTDGMQYPFATTVSTGDPKYDQRTAATSVEVPATPNLSDIERPASQRTGTIAGGISSTTVPFLRDDPENGHIILAVTVNGSRPLHVIFDTGGSNVVTPEVAREIGLKGSGAVAAGGAGEQHISAQMASGATLRLGDATLTNQTFAIIPLPPSLVRYSPTMRIDGIVGYEILKNFVVSIDYVKKTLTLTDPAAFKPDGAGAPVKFASATIPVIPVTFDGVLGQFMFDTGNGFYNTVSQAFLKEKGLGASVRGNVYVQSSGNLGGAIRPRIGRVDTIEIGPYTIERPVFAVTTTSSGALAGTTFAGNIAEPAMSHFNLTLDYGNSTIYFKPNKWFGRPETGSLTGMSLYLSDAGKLTVSYVNPGSPAAKAGLAAGDVILSVNGVAASALGTGTIAEQAAKHEAIAIDYARAGVRHAATLVPKEVLP